MRIGPPAASSLLALAGALLTGCGGIIPAVAGETYPVPVAVAQTAVVAPAPVQAPTPEPEPEPAKAKQARTPEPLPPAPVEAAPAPPAALDPAAPDPAAPAAEDQSGFARFMRYALASARLSGSGTELPSALLADPIALDGKRRRCAAGEQLVVVIDLDPAGSLFAPPANPAPAAAAVPGLALLRDVGFEIAWISDLPTERSGSVRTALEQSGLDSRGQDIISLRRDEADTKDQRKASLGGFACIVAIAGDERPDFDLRFKYLRRPQAGAALESIVGDGWFLVDPLIGN